MSLRVRKDGRMFCAATNPKLEGDVYIDDALHYTMSVMHGVIVTYPEPRHTDSGGEWFWSNAAPEGCDMTRANARKMGHYPESWEEHEWTESE